MSEFYKIIYIATISITFYLITSLVFRNRFLSYSHQHKLNKSVIIFLLAMLAIPLHAYYQLIDNQPPHFIFSAATSLVLIYGPLAQNFINLLIRQTPSKRQALPFAPFILVLIIKSLSITYDTYIMLCSFSLLALAYLINTIYLVANNKQRINSIYKYFKNSSYFWILSVVLALFSLIIFDMFIVYAFIFQQYHLLQHWHLFVALTCVFLMFISTMYAYQPRWFEFKRADISSETDITTKPVSESANDEGLDTDLASELIASLNQLFTGDKIYLNNNLTLSHLSDRLNVNNQIVSELLNKNLNTPFYEMINKYRFEHAKSLLTHENSSLSIIDIAFESGFNNKNTFNRVFKQNTGMTPSNYRKQQVNLFT